MGKTAKKPTYGEIVDATWALRNSAYGRILLDFVDLAWAVVEEIDVRAMLRYLVRRGKLERNGQGDAALYRVPAPTGLPNVVSRKIEKSREPWQGRWHVFSYDIPTTSNALRHRLVRHLHPMGFASLGRSVWISPYDWPRARAVRALEALRTHVEEDLRTSTRT